MKKFVNICEYVPGIEFEQSLYVKCAITTMPFLIFCHIYSYIGWRSY